MPYKLTQMQEENGILRMGDAMFNYLQLINFTVPVKEPLLTEPLPAQVYRSSYPAGEDGYWAYMAAKTARDAEFRRIYYANSAAREVYFQQFTDFASELALLFEIATQVVVGEDSTGQKIREYRIVEPCLYSYKQCADKLMGAYGPPPADPISFISYGYFG